MPAIDFVNLLGVMAIALLAPLGLGLVPWLRVPPVVLEILFGILVGPSVLGWLDADLAVEVVALLGLAMLLFLAGLEIDVHQLRGALLAVAVAGYVVTLLVGASAGLILDLVGWVEDPLLLAVTVSATSLGLVVAVVKDAGAVDGALGQTVIGAVVALSARSMRLGETLVRLQDTTAEIRVRGAMCCSWREGCRRCST